MSRDRGKGKRFGEPGGLQLVPAPAGTCQECATDHLREMPHNLSSLYYKYHFYARHKRWPTWSDAMTHCPSYIKKAWTEELIKMGETL